MRNHLEGAVADGRLRAIDLHTALFLEELSGRPAPGLLLAASLASQAVGAGHICLPLAPVAGQELFGGRVVAPALPAWRDELRGSGVVGESGGEEPLILDGRDRLYLARYHAKEGLIAEDLRRRSRRMLPVDEERAAKLLRELFPGNGGGEEEQKIAAAVAAQKGLTVISGGPGTGKTHTVARILALLQGLAGGSLRIGLAAPTGRAAARLQEAIRQAKQGMPPALSEAVPEEASTLHRILGLRPDSGRYRHHRLNPLHLDLLVIDESSMVDVPLMAALVDALPPVARLILLGDRDQLTSVEAGSLFGDICGGAQGGPSTLAEAADGGNRCDFSKPQGRGEASTCRGGINDSIVMLRTGHRFGAESGIGALARAVNSGDPASLAQVLTGRYRDLVLVAPPPAQFSVWLAERLLEGFSSCFAAANPAAALESFARFRVLCALREGPAGVAGVNALAEQVFRRRGLLDGSSDWYRGRPLMIRRNHYGLQLYNGDTGIVWPDRDGRPWAWFFRPDGTLTPIAPSRLPAHDTAYAATVHQAQGSEFENVLLLLPLQDNRLLSRELVYTGLTRARSTLTLADPAQLLAPAVSRRVQRFSGLTDRLRDGGDGEEDTTTHHNTGHPPF